MELLHVEGLISEISTSLFTDTHLMFKAMSEKPVRLRKETPQAPRRVAAKDRQVWRRVWSLKRSSGGSRKEATDLANSAVWVEVQTRSTLRINKKMRASGLFDTSW